MGEQNILKSGPETGVNRSGWTSRAISPGVERRSVRERMRPRSEAQGLVSHPAYRPPEVLERDSQRGLRA